MYLVISDGRPDRAGPTGGPFFSDRPETSRPDRDRGNCFWSGPVRSVKKKKMIISFFFGYFFMKFFFFLLFLRFLFFFFVFFYWAKNYFTEKFFLVRIPSILYMCKSK